MPSEQLLREWVRLLCEDEYGDLAMSDANVGPYGVHYGSGEELYNVFVKPFADVVGVASGKAKELSQRAQSLAKVVFEALATSVIPVLRDSYSEIFAKEKAELERIKKEHAEVYQATWDAFQKDDALVAAFMYAPTAFITAEFAQKSPKVAMKLLSVLSGGNLDPWLQKVKHKFGWDSEPNKPSSTPHYDSGVSAAPMEGVMREDKSQLPPIGKVLSNPKALQRIQQDPDTRRMEAEGKQVTRGTLQRAYKQAAAVARAKSLQDLQRAVGGKLKGLDKLQQVPQQERQAAEQALLAQVKKAAKAFYVKNLVGQADAAKRAGVPNDHPYVRDYESVISKVKAL